MIRNGIVFLLSILIFSCNYDELPGTNDADPNSIYFDYFISGDEESGMVTVRLQYKVGGKDGTSLVLEEPSFVEFDGIRLHSDSSKMSGVYYEIGLTLEQFPGPHSIRFTDANKKIFTETFEIDLISLAKEPATAVSRADLEFELNGLQTKDEVQVLLTDTSFFSRGIDRIDSIQDGKVKISKMDLEELRNGPVQLEFYKEKVLRLKEVTPAGGRIYFTYGVKRMFELSD